MKIYEACFILNTAGKETDPKDILTAIEKAIEENGGKSLKVQRMDRRQFARVTGKVDSGYYANFVFEMAPEKVNVFREKFKLNENVYRLMITDAPKGAEAADVEPAVQA